MNEAPKEIWLDSDMTAWEHYSEEDTPYIRADIVDELVEALKGLAVHDFGANGWNHSAERYAIKARAALKKLEENK